MTTVYVVNLATDYEGETTIGVHDTPDGAISTAKLLAAQDALSLSTSDRTYLVYEFGLNVFHRPFWSDENKVFWLRVDDRRKELRKEYGEAIE